MSSRKRRQYIKKIRDSIPTITLKELEDQGRVPKYQHLNDHVEMEEYKKQFDGYKEWERKIKKKDES